MLIFHRGFLGNFGAVSESVRHHRVNGRLSGDVEGYLQSEAIRASDRPVLDPSTDLPAPMQQVSLVPKAVIDAALRHSP